MKNIFLNKQLKYLSYIFTLDVLFLVFYKIFKISWNRKQV